jgi:hypothetical protein
VYVIWATVLSLLSIFSYHRIKATLSSDQRFYHAENVSEKLEMYLLCNPGKRKHMTAVMFLMCLTCGTIEGFNKTSFKLFDCAVAEGKVVISIILFAMAGSGSLTYLYTLNLAMKLFQQIEIVPCLQSLLLIMNITAGLVMLREYEPFSKFDFVKIVTSVLVILLGIFANGYSAKAKSNEHSLLQSINEPDCSDHTADASCSISLIKN